MRMGTAERIMGCLVLAGFFLLSRQAALVSAGKTGTAVIREERSGSKEERQVLVIDPGHGGKNLCSRRVLCSK